MTESVTKERKKSKSIAGHKTRNCTSIMGVAITTRMMLAKDSIAREQHQCRKAPDCVNTIHIDGVDTIKHERHSIVLVMDAFIFYIGSICQQGLTFSTSSISGRCIVITSLFSAFAIFQFYSASIVSSLLMERPKTIRTVHDLAHSSLEIGIEDILYNRDYFRRTKDRDAIELYNKKIAWSDGGGNLTTNYISKSNSATSWYNPAQGVAKLKKGKFAFHVDIATAYKIISDTFTESEICDLTEIELFPVQKTVACVQKGSPLRKMITYGLRRVGETGLMDYQKKIWHSPKPPCVRRIHTDDLHVDMETIFSALILLFFGYAFSLMICCLEFLYKNLSQRFDFKEISSKINGK